MNPCLRSLACAALLMVLPFGGIRVICVESPRTEAATDAAAASESASEPERPLTDCERLCPYHPPDSVSALHSDAESSSDEDADCALSSDAAALQMLGTIAVMRTVPALVVPDLVSDAPIATSALYLGPSIAHLAPPPKVSSI